MEELLGDMQSKYASMTDMLSEATVTPDAIDKQLALS